MLSAVSTTDDAADQYFNGPQGDSENAGFWNDPDFWTGLVGGVIEGIGTIAGVDQDGHSAEVNTPNGPVYMYMHPDGLWYTTPPHSGGGDSGSGLGEMNLSNPLLLLGLAYLVTR
jgi:hypothetical protein